MRCPWEPEDADFTVWHHLSLALCLKQNPTWSGALWKFHPAFTYMFAVVKQSISFGTTAFC